MTRVRARPMPTNVHLAVAGRELGPSEHLPGTNKYPLPNAIAAAEMKLIVFGPPSAGKGTQSQKLAQKYGIPQVATGDLLREAVAKKTPLGMKIQSYLDQGKLGPDDLIVQLMTARISRPDCRNGYLLDGFPRTIGQALAFDRMTDIDLVLNIVVDFELLVDRSVGRRICKECATVYHVSFNPPAVEGICDKCGSQLIQRKDDKEETVRHRLDVYSEQTAPLIEYYRQKGKLVDIDGSVGIDGVFQQMVAAIERLKKRNSKKQPKSAPRKGEQRSRPSTAPKKAP